MQGTQIRVVFTYMPFFANVTVVSMEFAIRICLPVFFQTGGIFYQVILTYTICRGPNESLIKKNLIS